MSKMVKSDKKSGFSLVEVILSLAIMGMLALFFMPLFTGSYRQVAHIGNLSRIVFQSQQDMELQIGQGTDTKDFTLIIVLPGLDDPISVQGEYFTDGKLSMFLPAD